MHTMACPRHGRRSTAKIKAYSLSLRNVASGRKRRATAHGRHVLLFEEKGEEERKDIKREIARERGREGSPPRRKRPTVERNSKSRRRRAASYSGISRFFARKVSFETPTRHDDFFELYSLTFIKTLTLSESLSKRCKRTVNKSPCTFRSAEE